jgi:hypothetical protein
MVNLSLESPEVAAVLERYKTGLVEESDRIAQNDAEFAEALAAVAEAREAADGANEELASARERQGAIGLDDHTARQALADRLAEAAIGIAESELPLITRTFLSLVYVDTSYPPVRNFEVYKNAVQRGGVALSSLVGRLQPGAPLVVLERDNVFAAVAGEDSLVVTPPTVKDGELVGGSIVITMPDTPMVEICEGLPITDRRTANLPVLSGTPTKRYGGPHLEAAASNDWLIIGLDALAKRLPDPDIDPMRRFMALTALHAVGVELPVAVDDIVRTNIGDQLVELLAFKAAGSGPETETTSTPKTMHNGHVQLPRETLVTRQARQIDNKSIRHMAAALGLTQKELRGMVEPALMAWLKRGGRPARAVEKANALNNLDTLLIDIFLEIV